MTARAKALGKLRKLLRLADPKRNSNPGERSNAKRAASKLIQEWGFTSDDIPGEEPAAKKAAPFDPKQPSARCYRCNVDRNYYGTRCVVCGRPIWDLVTTQTSNTIRTTSATYERLVRFASGPKRLT